MSYICALGPVANDSRRDDTRVISERLIAMVLSLLQITKKWSSFFIFIVEGRRPRNDSSVLSISSCLLLLSRTLPESYQSSLLYRLPIVSVVFLCHLHHTDHLLKCIFCALMMCTKYCSFRFLTLATNSQTQSSGVTRVGDTRGGNWGCHPSIFFLKNLATLFCSSLSLSLSLFIAFTRVSPPPGCHPTPFLPVRPRFSTILCKFAHKIFSLRVSPPGGCYPGRSAPSLVTPLTQSIQWYI